MGIKRYKGYTIKKEIDNNSINKRNKNINYISLFLILANLYLLPQYLNISSRANEIVGDVSMIEKNEANNQRQDEAYKVNFISEGINVISGPYRDKIIDFHLIEDQLTISFKDEEGVIIQDIDKVVENSSVLRIMDIELLQDSNIKIRMVRTDE